MACAVCCFAVASCQDDTFRDFYSGEEGKGLDVRFTVDLPPLNATELSSRGSAGNIIKEFDESTLHIYVYNEDGSSLIYHCGKEGLIDYKYDSNGNNSTPAYPYGKNEDGTDREYSTSAGEKTTPRATFKFATSPFVAGTTYQVYVTANVTVPEQEFQTANGLKDHIVDWNLNDTKANNQMMGMFALSSDCVEGEAVNFSTSSTYYLHAWLVRCASKVTVSFDTTNLNDNTWIYLHSVTIHNVPVRCKLGNGNQATEEEGNGVHKNGETIMYAPEGSRYENAEAEFTTWPTLTRGTEHYGSDHSETAEALFFYENLQGSGKDKSQIDSDKTTPEGEVSWPGSVNEGEYGHMDNMPYGTYIEVEAYYRSTTKGNEGMGTIKYRFQLGMDTFKDYNAFRNHHFKLILNFRGNANDVDWHIDYTPNTDNPIYVPHPFYISYLYGEEVEIPITVDGKLTEGTKVIAEIVENNWKPQDAPSNVYWTGEVWSSKNVKYDGPWNGFLSLRPSNALSNNSNNDASVPNSDVIGRDNDGLKITDANKAYLMSYWYGGYENMGNLDITPKPSSTYFYSKSELMANERMYIPNQGYREYDTSNRHGETKDELLHNNDHYDIIEVTNGEKTKTHLYLPLYTRALFMVKAFGFSGANPYFFYQRKAVVKITCWVDRTDANGNTVSKKYSKLCDVIQVRRIINPCGIYREAGNNKSFTVNLSFRTSENATTFMPFASEGKWSAEIESGDPGFITLNGQQKVQGRTGEFIKFQVHFVPTSSTSKNRYAVILVKYHDYTCKHRIIVRQGYDPDQVVDYNINGMPAVYWHCFNLRGGEYEAESPLEAGSLFRWGNLDYAIAASNNSSDQVGANPANKQFTLLDKYGNVVEETVKWPTSAQGNAPDASKPNLGFQTFDMKLNNKGQDEKRQIFYSQDVNFRKYLTLRDANGKEIKSGKRTRLARFREWRTLREDPRLVYTYGICYDGNSTGTSFTSDNAFNYSEHNPDKTGSGMRGIFIYNQEDGRNFFLPVGASGYGRRKNGGVSDTSTDDLPGTLRYAGRSFYMPAEAVYRLPMFWNIKDNIGAIYWGFPDVESRTDAWDHSTLGNFTAWDINFSTYDFNQFGDNAYRTQTSNTHSGGIKGSDGQFYFSDAAFIRLVDVPDGSDDPDEDP